MNQIFREKLQQGLQELGFSPTNLQLDSLLTYLDLLNQWNKAYNLTAIKEPEQMLKLHLLDSLSIAEHLQGERFIDVGTGPGLPGIPLAIMYPQKNFTLLDSNGKRVRFLFHVRQTLNLSNVQEVQSRVEKFQPERAFDGVISRAFASLQDMLEQCQQLVAADGHFYAMKGKYPEEELSQLPKKYMVSAVRSLTIPGVEAERHLIDLTLS